MGFKEAIAYSLAIAMIVKGNILKKNIPKNESSDNKIPMICSVISFVENNQVNKIVILLP